MFGNKKEENRFEHLRQDHLFGSVLVDLIKDKETGVLYLSRSDGGFTVLVDRDGKPLIDSSEEETQN